MDYGIGKKPTTMPMIWGSDSNSRATMKCVCCDQKLGAEIPTDWVCVSADGSEVLHPEIHHHQDQCLGFFPVSRHCAQRVFPGFTYRFENSGISNVAINTAIANWRNALRLAAGELTAEGVNGTDESEVAELDAAAARAFEALSKVQPETVAGAAALGAALVLEILEVMEGRTFGSGRRDEALAAVERASGSGATEILKTLLDLAGPRVDLPSERKQAPHIPASEAWLGAPA